MITITEATEISVFAEKLDEARRLVAETMRDSQDYPIFTEREIVRLREMKINLEAIADRIRIVDEDVE